MRGIKMLISLIFATLVVPLSMGARPAFFRDSACALPQDGPATSDGAPLASDIDDLSLRFTHFSVAEGLAVTAPFSIIQDRHGFIWITTEGGLNKYDGYTFTIYRHDLEDPTSLGLDFVDPICEDSTGILWIGTGGAGLDRFDRDTQQFIHYRYQADDPASLSNDTVRAIYEDRQGVLWIGTEGGLNQFDRNTQRFIRYQHDDGDPASLSDNIVRAIYEDRAGVLWVGTAGGLDRFDRAGQRFTHYQHDPANPGSLSDSSVWAIYEDRAGTLWFGTERGGLNRFDRGSGQFVHFRHDKSDPRSLSDDFVSAIYEDSQGRFWVGTFGSGLNLYDRETGQFAHYRYRVDDPDGLSGDAVREIYEDDAGALWVITTLSAVNRADPANQRFTLYRHNPDDPNSLSSNAVWAIIQDHTGIVWIGTMDGGLNRFDHTTGQFTHYRHDPDDPNSLSSDWVWFVYEDRAGMLWIATEGGGLDMLNPETGQFTHYRHDPNDPTSLGYDSAIVVYEDNTGALWVGTGSNTYEGNGLDKLDRSTGQFTHYRHDPDDPASLSSNVAWWIYEDRTGTFWVGTLDGLNRLDKETGKFTRYLNDPDDPYSLGHNIVAGVYEDRAGRLWFATYGGGISQFDRATETFIHYDEGDGLADNSTYGILEDAAGNLWISTNGGISKFNPETKVFKNYDVRDGLQGNEFNLFACLNSSWGEMFFGGPHGISVFRPEQVRDNPYVPPVVITDFQLFNESVKPGPDSPLHHAIEDTGEIELSHRDRVLAFEFVALNYTLPEKNQYAYMLEGFDQDWTYRDSGRRFATYTNLDPGEYVFRVKASNNDGVWNEEGVSLRVKVIPPWWNRWWFYTLALTSVLGIGLFIYCSKSSQLKTIRVATLALQKSEQNYREVFSATSDALFIQDETSRVLDVNDRACAMFGYDRETALGLSVGDLSLGSPPYSQAEAEEWVRRTIQEGPQVFEWQCKRRNGELFWSEVALYACEIVGEKRAVASVRDITERKQAEAQLERNLRETHVRLEVSQALAHTETEDAVFNALLQSAGFYLQACVLIYALERQGNELVAVVHSANPFESGVLLVIPVGARFSLSDFAALRFLSADRPFVSDDVFADERVDPASLELVRRAGAISFAAVPLTIGTEWLGFIVALSKLPGYFDEEKQHLYQTLAEQGAVALRAARLREAIRESQQRLALLVQQSPLGVIEWNMALQVVSWNPAAERIFGYINEEALGRYTVGFIVPEAATALLNQFMQDLLVQRDGMHSINENLTRDGRSIICEWFNAPLVDTDGQVIGIVSLVQDITERKRAEVEREVLIAELEAKNAELERFAYTVSHDLKSPLITIGGFVGFLEKDAQAGDVERIRADMVRINEATTRMQRLLNELLELSRIGRLMNPPEEASFEEIVREAVELVHGRIEARGVEVEIASGLPSVYGDRARLVEVVQNLVDNACKFMGDQPYPRVEIGVQQEAGQPVFTVRDNGMGIEPQYHDKVFGLFDKLDPQSEGTGIGLALVKRIVETHGGKIWIESGGLGHGSTFYFTLSDTRQKT